MSSGNTKPGLAFDVSATAMTGTPEGFKPISAGPIKCHEFLGGLLRHYYREAA